MIAPHQFLHAESCARLAKMTVAAELVLYALVIASAPLASVGFCSATTAGSAHQLHGAPRAGRGWVPVRKEVLARATAAAAAADDAPTTFTDLINELSDDGSGSSERFDSFADFLVKTQADICRQAEDSDGRATFCTDRWEREGASKVGCWCCVYGFVFTSSTATSGRH